MMTYLMVVVIFFAICGIIILISDKKEGKFNKVISKHGVSFKDGILTIQSCGSDMGEIIRIHKESDFAIGYKPKELHVGSATVGGVTTGGTYTTGGYHYSTGASSSGKYSLRYMPTAGGIRLTTGEQVSKNGEVINSIRLTSDLFAKARNSSINQYLNELSDSIVVVDNNVKLEAHELLELRMFANGQGGTSHAVHKAYPTYEKCSAIMSWLTQNN